MIYPIGNPTYDKLLNESIREFQARSPRVMKSLLDFKLSNKPLVKIRQNAMQVYQRNLRELNIFDKNEIKADYKYAQDELKRYLQASLSKSSDVEMIYDSIIAEVNPKEDALVKMYNNKVKLFGTSDKAKEIITLTETMDQLESKLQRIKNEAAANNQTELTKKQLTKYNKTIRDFNNVREQHATAIRDFQAMKALNQTIFDDLGLSEFYKPYTEFSYIFSKKVPLTNGVSASSIQSIDGTRKYIYSAYPFSDIAPNGNQIVEIKGAPNTYLAINSKNDRILSLIEEKPGEKRKIYHFNEDGDVFKTAIFDPKTKTSKVYTNKKLKKQTQYKVNSG